MHLSDPVRSFSRQKLGGALLLAALCAWPSDAAAAAKPTKLTITEITYVTGNNTGWQWVELYNGSKQTVDLSTYVLDQGGGDIPFRAANLKGKVAPGKFAIVYDFAMLGSAACTGRPLLDASGEAACAVLFKQAWPRIANDVVLVPFFVQGAMGNFPNIFNGPPPQSWAKVVSLWASWADYLQDTKPADLRRKPAHAVCSVAAPLQPKNIAAWTKLTQAHADPRDPASTHGPVQLYPTLYLSNPGGDPMDEANWSWSEDGKGGAYRSSTTGTSPFAQSLGWDIGSPGQLP